MTTVTEVLQEITRRAAVLRILLEIEERAAEMDGEEL